MSYEEYCRFCGTPIVDQDDLFCIQYLEERGQRFCVDFGYQNAKDKAADLARVRLAA